MKTMNRGTRIHIHISIINSSKNVDYSNFLSRKKRKQVVVTVITYARLARGKRIFTWKCSPTNDIRWMGQDLPHSSGRKLSNIDTIWNVWYQRLWHQPTFPGTFRRKAGAPSVSHVALISAGIRKSAITCISSNEEIIYNWKQRSRAQHARQRCKTWLSGKKKEKKRRWLYFMEADRSGGGVHTVNNVL